MSRFDRRMFLKAAAALSAGVAAPWLGGCSLDDVPGNQDPEPRAGAGTDDASVALAALPAMDPLVHLLRRTRFGTTAADLDAARALGAAGYLEQQLQAPSLLDPVYLEATLRFPATALVPPLDLALGLAPEQATQQLAEKTLFLAAYSDRQLYEVMVDFWTNHFNVENVTGELPLRKLYDDVEVARAHAFGRFRDLLHASAKSPAMLEYLDSVNNVVAGPNQNYARELMELHTLGVDGGYTEEDVREVARCFTGWRINGTTRRFEFNAANHDDGDKRVLGEVIPAGGGVTDGERVLDLLAAHPSTARFIATKLVRRFVAEAAPATLVETLAQVFRDSGGDVPSLLRALFGSAEFQAAQDRKFRRPLELVAGMWRTAFADRTAYDGAAMIDTLSRMGQIPHRWFPPDGYPDRADYWLNTSALLEYWNLAAEAAEKLDLLGASRVAHHANGAGTARQLVDQLAQRLLQRPLAEPHRQLLLGLVDGGAPDAPLATETLGPATVLVAGLLLASPYFTLR